MVNRLFIDTGAFYALADRRDPAHRRARDFYESSQDAFVTTDFVFAETMSLLTKRLAKTTAVAFGTGIRQSPRIHVEEVAPEIREAAWELFSGRLDKNYDLIDCVSFALMEKLRLEAAFGFDRHFVQLGLRIVPE